MPEPLEWELKIPAELSGVKEANAELAKFSLQLKDANVQLQALGIAEKKEGDAAKDSKSAHEGMWEEILKGSLAAEAIEAVTEKLVDMGIEFGKWAIDVTDADYKAQVALTHMTGSSEEAENIIERARAYSLGTAQDLDKVTETFTRLAGTGLRGDMLTASVAAANDLAISSGRAFEQTSQLFEMIGSDRGLGSRAAMQLYQFPQLLKVMERDLHAVSFQDLQEKLKAAPIKGVEAMQMLQREIMEVAHEKALGNAAAEQSDTIGGSFEKIKTSFEIMLGKMGTSPEFAHLRLSLSEIADWFNPATASGKKMEQVLKGALEPVLKLIDQISQNPDELRHFFESALAPVEHLSAAIAPFAHVIHGLEGIGEAAADIFTGQGLASKRAENERLDRQVAAGIKFQEGDLGFGDQTPDEWRKGVPHIPEHALGADIYHPTIALVGEDAPERIGPIPGAGESGSSSGGHVFHINIPVQVIGGSGDDDEQSIENQLNSFLPGMLINALEQAGQQMGGR